MKQVETWQRSELTDVSAKVVIYASWKGNWKFRNTSRGLLHDLYFEPRYEKFRSRAIWSLSNAFTSAFKELDPIPQVEAANLH